MNEPNEAVEVHLNTRGCEPMQPETAAALGRAFQAVHKQFSDPTPDPRATVELLTRLDAEMPERDWYANPLYPATPGTVTRYVESPAGWICETGNKGEHDGLCENIAALRNALPSIIRDLRRLVALEEENAELKANLDLAGEPEVIEGCRIAALEADRDAAWAAADALAGPLEKLSRIAHYHGCGAYRGLDHKCTCPIGAAVDALSAYTAARAARGTA